MGDGGVFHTHCADFSRPVEELSIVVFWRTPSPKPHTTGSSRHDRLRQLTPSVSFVEESIGEGRFTSNVTGTPTFRKQQLTRKGLSQRVQNHNQHPVVQTEPDSWQVSRQYVSWCNVIRRPSLQKWTHRKNGTWCWLEGMQTIVWICVDTKCPSLQEIWRYPHVRWMTIYNQ